MMHGSGWNRREWLLYTGTGGALGLVTGCLPPRSSSTSLRPAERSLLGSGAGTLPIVQYRLGLPNPGSVLRRRAEAAHGLPGAALRTLDRRMRSSLKKSGGVGLAAPQVGLARRVALVQLQTKQRPVLTCVDPRIVRRSTQRVDGYEACLSIRGVGGLVARARWVEVEFRDLAGKRRRLKSSGWEARIFQHELDHLDGRLYVDWVRGALLPLDEVRRRRRRGRSEVSGRLGESLAMASPAPEGVLL